MWIFSEQKALELATFSSFQKGKEYFEDGCVEKLWSEGDLYKAKVCGTHAYTVTFQREDDRLKATCTCPYAYEGICKHAVAAIFAFAKSNDFENIAPLQKGDKEEEAKKLIDSAIEEQLRTFIQCQLKKSPSLIEDFRIFLQGPKATGTTLAEYKERIRHELDQLDMDDLLNQWYAEDDDYYDYQSEYTPDFGPALTDVTKSFFDQAEKYLSSRNIEECYKLYQALFEALDEKQQTLSGDEAEVSDLFVEEMEKALRGYGKSMASVKDDHLKHIGITYLCSLFEESHSWQPHVVSALKQGVVSSFDAQVALGVLSKSDELQGFSVHESSLYTLLHHVNNNFMSFEQICLNHARDNPQLAVDLLKHYKKQGERQKIISVGEKILPHLEEKSANDEISYYSRSSDHRDIEKEIRLILKETYDLQTNYRQMIENLERLFIITCSLADYKEAAKTYKTQTEKEEFIIRLKEILNDQYTVKTLFKVLLSEGKKADILILIEKFPEADCFPQMVSSVHDIFPKECFKHYEKKIKELLIEAKTDLYPQVAYHLKQMKKISMDKEFDEFITWIKTTYWRRRRLLEELEKERL
jgi:uncharacterized Zn finger protein